MPDDEKVTEQEKLNTEAPVEDVTERIRMEEALRMSNCALGVRVKELNCLY